MEISTTTKRSPQGSKGNLQSIIVKIDKQKHLRLRRYCLNNGTTMASVIRKAIDQYLE